MVQLLVWFVVLLAVFGFVVWAVENAPFISPTVKPFIRWAVIVIAGLCTIYLLLSLLGVVSGGPIVLDRPVIHVR